MQNEFFYFIGNANDFENCDASFVLELVFRSICTRAVELHFFWVEIFLLAKLLIEWAQDFFDICNDLCLWSVCFFKLRIE